ncbi:MAG: carbohydrate ABC transporter permease [Candidatus Eremiobacteraeota bacterium]|nr:carbohydrate ABC transporter permease [Candidatus Eremiobacteraeota bacterium]
MKYKASRELLPDILLFAIALFLLFPIYWLVTMAFKTQADTTTWPPKFWFTPTLDNFRVVLGQPPADSSHVVIAGATGSILPALGHSLVISIGALIVSLVVGIPAAYALARYDFKGRESIAFTFLSFRFAPALLIIIPLFVIFRNLGLYDSYLGMIWVYQLITLPIVVWIIRGYFEDVPLEIEEAAKVDGLSTWGILKNVALPMAAPGIAAAGLLAFIYAWNNFIFILILGGEKTQTVTLASLNFLSSEQQVYGQMAAAVVLSVLPVLALALWGQRYLVRGLSLGAVKE